MDNSGTQAQILCSCGLDATCCRARCQWTGRLLRGQPLAIASVSHSLSQSSTTSQPEDVANDEEEDVISHMLDSCWNLPVMAAVLAVVDVAMEDAVLFGQLKPLMDDLPGPRR